MLKKLLVDESAQGITEYGAVLAMVALIVALVFGITKGALLAGCSTAYSVVVSQLNAMSSSAASASS